MRFCWKGDSFCIHYHAETDQDTILNLTNHSYFNLNGKGDVQKQLLKIHADLFTPNDDVCLPTGEILPVAGTAMDFRRFKAIGQDADNDEDCVRAIRKVAPLGDPVEITVRGYELSVRKNDAECVEVTEVKGTK